jgi:predicted dehydrogenase
MIRVGVIGLGGMGLYQARTFDQIAACQLVAGADPSAEMRTRFAQTFPHAQAYVAPEDLLAQANVDAVVIAVPTGLHQPIASAALAARIPVLLEKPMARTVAQCQRLIDEAEGANTLLMVAHCRRFDPYWMAWGQYVSSGKLGAPVLWRDIRASVGIGGWYLDEELGGGPLLDGAIHNYDFANLIFGEPESVFASAIKLDPSVSAVDTASTIIRYRTGHQLLISWSWVARGTTLHDVVGPEGFIQFGTAGMAVPAEELGRYQYCCYTDRAGEQTLIKTPRQPDMYTLQAEHFLACVRGEATCQSPGAEAIKAVAVAEAVLKAAREGKERSIGW